MPRRKNPPQKKLFTIDESTQLDMFSDVEKPALHNLPDPSPPRATLRTPMPPRPDFGRRPPRVTGPDTPIHCPACSAFLECTGCGDPATGAHCDSGKLVCPGCGEPSFCNDCQIVYHRCH